MMDLEDIEPGRQPEGGDESKDAEPRLRGERPTRVHRPGEASKSGSLLEDLQLPERTSDSEMPGGETRDGQGSLQPGIEGLAAALRRSQEQLINPDPGAPDSDHLPLPDPPGHPVQPRHKRNKRSFDGVHSEPSDDGGSLDPETPTRARGDAIHTNEGWRKHSSPRPPGERVSESSQLMHSKPWRRPGLAEPELEQPLLSRPWMSLDNSLPAERPRRHPNWLPNEPPDGRQLQSGQDRGAKKCWDRLPKVLCVFCNGILCAMLLVFLVLYLDSTGVFEQHTEPQHQDKASDWPGPPPDSWNWTPNTPKNDAMAAQNAAEESENWAKLVLSECDPLKLAEVEAEVQMNSAMDHMYDVDRDSHSSPAEKQEAHREYNQATDEYEKAKDRVGTDGSRKPCTTEKNLF